MKYYLIENEGVMDKNAIILMGASTKRGDKTKIGMFGTGASYGLATLLRNDIPVRIFSDGVELSVEVEDVRLGLKTFRRLIIDGERTSITTDLGLQWTVPMAIREFYANGVDETLLFFDMTDEIVPKQGITQIYVEATDQVMDFYLNKDDYLAIDKEVLYADTYNNSIYAKHNMDTRVYRRKINCYSDTYMSSTFDYDFPNITIGEDRLTNSQYEIGRKIWRLLGGCDDVSIVSKILEHADSSTFEMRMMTNYIYDKPMFKTAWMEALKDKVLLPVSAKEFISVYNINNGCVVPDKMYKYLVETFPELNQDNIKTIGESTMSIEKKMNMHDDTMSNVMLDLRKAGLKVSFHSWEVVTFLKSDNKIFPDSKTKTMYISKNLFHQNYSELLVSVIIGSVMIDNYVLNDSADSVHLELARCIANLI